jgi:hypothetical protein
MKHFEIGQWVDMVRGLATAATEREMSDHLSSGCRPCRRTVEVLREVALFAGREARNEVPSYAVQSARAIFALQQPEKVYLFPRIVGRLIYDSFKEPLPAGLRARHRVTRHALYQAGEHSVDLRLEHQRGGATVTLVGQIVNQAHPETPVTIFPVFLLSGKKILAHATSNAFGEFQLEYRPRQGLRLYLQGNQDLPRPIEVRLQGLAEEESDGEVPDRGNTND